MRSQNNFSALALALSVAMLSACGGNSGSIGGGTSGGTSGGTTSGTTGGTGTVNLRIGYLNGGTFTAGAILIGQTTPLAAGGSTGLRVDVVDANANNALYTGATLSVTFNSSCVSQGLATVVSPVATATGSASSTYAARGCSGNDVITATVIANNQTLTASGIINVSPATARSLQFISATPSIIGVRGTGHPEASVVVFQLRDNTGGPIVNRPVSFTLDTSVGGITLSPASGTTDNAGNVQTTVGSGTVPTPVVVTASTPDPAGGNPITGSSTGLTITTGVPDQNSFTLAVQQHNIEGDNIVNLTTTVSARLSDRFNNPVFDGTVINFASEGGTIDGSCSTVAGSCSVQFTTSNPRSRTNAAAGTAVYQGNNCGISPGAPSHAVGCDDHRYTVFATAIGEETYTDSNGNGYFDAGEPFDDLAEPFLDSNENGTFDASYETLLNGDFNRNGVRDPASGNYTGLLCNSGCDTAHSLLVSAEQIIVMSSSTPIVSVSPNPVTVPAGGNVLIRVGVSDTAGQSMAAGTTVTATSTIGTVTALTPGPLADTTDAGPSLFLFSLAAPATTGTGTLVVSVRSSTGLVTSSSYDVTVN